jgi:predicted glycoside hydrolase/deacetylase ChbG (UPF0249 family)
MTAESAASAARELIINADDFGMSASVNRGIIKAHEEGVVTSTSLMVRRDGAAQAAAYARSHPKLSVGLHVDLGEWVCRDQEWSPLYVVADLQSRSAVNAEVTRQLAAFRDLVGADPTHIDSHQHVHREGAAEFVLVNVARRLGVPLRHFTDRVQYCGEFYGQEKYGVEAEEAITVAGFLDLVPRLPRGITELCCHPGDEEQPGEQYGSARPKELATLCDPRVRAALEEHGIILRSFRDLAPHANARGQQPDEAVARAASKRRTSLAGLFSRSKPSPAPAPAIKHPEKLILMGMMTRHPVAGMVWLTMQYLIGWHLLGYDVYYVEAHGGTPKSFMSEGDDGSRSAAAFLDSVFKRFGLPNRWAYQSFHSDGRSYGMSEHQVNTLFQEAALIFNLHGGTPPRPEHTRTGRLVYLGTDPVDREVALERGDQEIRELFAAHATFFTWGENYGKPDCKVPYSREFHMVPSRQPIVMDCWNSYGLVPGKLFTTVGSWRQLWREIKIDGENYGWSKHNEFMKFIDIPQRTSQKFELALGGCNAEDRAMLENAGWRVRDGLVLSADIDDYRRYLVSSRGEFTVAKDQNVRLRSGWFSDRSAAYLAAGRPVITQDTGFGNTLPVGEGLFPFNTSEDVLNAVDDINSDYARHSRAAYEIAREYFRHDRVLTEILEHSGL